jgi:hypothetical protein
MSFRYAAILKQYLVFRTLLTCLVDGSRCSTSGHGFLELQSNNNISRYFLMLTLAFCRTYQVEHLLGYGFGTRLVHFIFI